MSILFRRLVLAADVNRLPQLTAAQIAEFVQGFSVANERSTTGRYLADFTVRFRADAVRALFQQYRVRFAEAESKPLLVFPVYGASGSAVLWEEPNPWRLAWAQAGGRGGLVPIEVPLGDLSDMNAVGAEQAIAGDAERLRALADRYGTSEILVAQARLDGDPESGTAALRVESRQGGSGSLAAGPSGSYQQQPGEDFPALLARAVEGTIVPIETAWKQQNALDFSTQNQVLVSVRFADVGEFGEVQRRLSQVPTILNRSVSLLKRNRADMRLTVLGSLNQFGTAMAQRGLLLEKPGYGAGGIDSGSLGATAPQWTVRLAGGAAPARSAPGGFSFNDLAREAVPPAATSPDPDGSVERVDDATGSGTGTQ